MGDKKKGGGMARKGKEIQLQREIETQEDWEDMLSKEGLCVVDVYQGWCGICSGMTSHFKKMKIELKDDLLNFIAAKSDTIDALEKYRGRCEPCFLFFAGGVLVAVIRGANAPLILRTITEQLAQEHKVLDGQAERKEIKDTMIAKLEEEEKQREEEEAVEEEPKKEVSVVIIKPDAVQSGKAEEIMEEMKNRGIEILRQEERQLTDEEVKNVYIHLQDEPYFEELVNFMTSAPSIVLAITKGKTGQNIIQEFRELIGPTEVEEAKEQAPESLRAKFGSEKYMNAVHGSDSQDTAARELAFFFPDFVAPTVEGKPKLQRTLALIRPDAYKNNKDQILQKIRESGFKVAMQKEVNLTKEQAEEFYKEHEGQEYFDELTTRMSSGPLLALGLAREDAIAGWRQMLGPTKVEEAQEQEPESLRAQFAEEGSAINMLHGSDSEETAQKEIEYFFPMEQTLAVIKPDAYGTKDDIVEKIHEAGFRIAARKETTLSREIAEEFYGDLKDKEYYSELVEHMCSGPTYFMVLSREGAVDGWRSLIGPTDPSQAKEQDPETIRGMFGQDTLRNAVHGSSNKEHAMKNIEKIFEDTEVSEIKDTEESKQISKKEVKEEPQIRDTVSTEKSDTTEQVPKPDTATGVPDVVLHAVASIDPDHLEEAIAEQQEITYEPAPEHGGPGEKPPSPKPEEKKEEQAPQQEEQQPAEQEPTQQEQSEAQEEKQEEEAQPAPESAPEQEPEPEKTEAEEKPKSPEPQAQEPEGTEQTQETPGETEQKPADEGEPEKPAEQQQQAEPEPEQKEEAPKEEPAEAQQEAQPDAQPETQPEAQAETTEEKKEEETAEQKEETKTEEQKAEGEEQQAA